MVPLRLPAGDVLGGHEESRKLVIFFSKGDQFFVCKFDQHEVCSRDSVGRRVGFELTSDGRWTHLRLCHEHREKRVPHVPVEPKHE